MKKQRGITLVSLVVTIIVLIILTGISINTLVGQNGVITRAQQAKENMMLAQQREEEQLNEIYEQLEGSNQGIPPEEGTIGDLTNKLQELQSKFDNIQVEYNDFKIIIAEAITENGVETQVTDTAEVMVENIKKLSESQKAVILTVTTTTAEAYSANWGIINISSLYPNYKEITAENIFIKHVSGNLMASGQPFTTDIGIMMPVSYNASTGVITVKTNSGPVLAYPKEGTYKYTLKIVIVL